MFAALRIGYATLKRLLDARDADLSEELYETVQLTLKKNSERSSTLQANPEREYLLKCLIHCASCQTPMWAQTYRNGNGYYLE